MAEPRDHDKLPKALQPFSRALAINDALPDRFRPSDETPLQRCLAGSWPTLADLRSLINWGAENLSPPAVAVKPLEWTEPTKPNEECSYDHIRAEGAWTYQIEWKSWKEEYAVFVVYRDGAYVGAYDSLEVAKAAAQADYETRVRSAIVSPAVPAGWKLVPLEPKLEMLGAWYRYKNGHHWPDEPEPPDTSDYGAYRAMLAAAPEVPHE